MTENPSQEIAAPTSKSVSVNGPEEATLMNLIAKMASDPAADVPKLERLIALRNDEMARQAKLAYDADFVLMKPELPLVIRRHKNSQTSSNYAKLEDINKDIDPILSKYGFGTSAKVISQNETHVTMALSVIHRSGHTERMELTLPIDNKGAQGSVNKTIVHGISSTISYIKRVGFCAMLNISTGDDKDGNTESDFLTVEQAADIDLRARQWGEGYFTKFLGYMKVESVKDIRKADYKKAITQLKSSEAEAERRKKSAPKQEGAA